MRENLNLVSARLHWLVVCLSVPGVGLFLLDGIVQFWHHASQKPNLMLKTSHLCGGSLTLCFWYLCLLGWLANNCLQFNSSTVRLKPWSLLLNRKFLGSKNTSVLCSPLHNPASETMCVSTTNMVLFDQSVSLDRHSRLLVKSCFYHLRNISKLSGIIQIWPQNDYPCFCFLSFRLLQLSYYLF